MLHPLDGCWAKIQRAEESIRNLNRDITAYLGSDPKPYEIVGRHQNDGREYALVAYGDPVVPPRFAVLAGEIIHHLRSSLDHLVYALVVENGETPTRNHQFPICTSVKTFEATCISGVIKGVSDSAKKIIQSVQPHTSATPDDTVLYAIHQCDVLDKHRLLLVVTTVAKIGQTLTLGTDKEIAAKLGKGRKPPAIVSLGDPAPRKIAEDGVVIFTIGLAEPAPEFRAKADFVPQIAFEKCGRAELVPVVQVLTGMLKGTTHTLKLFDGEF